MTKRKKEDWNVVGVEYMKRFPNTYAKFLKDYYPNAYKRHLKEQAEEDKGS